MRNSRWIHSERHSKGSTMRSWGLGFLIASLTLTCSMAWAYKVEKVCTDIAATAADNAKKVCKIVRVDPNKASAPKEEKKEEKKHGGH